MGTSGGLGDSYKPGTVFGEFSVVLICNLPEVWQLFNGYRYDMLFISGKDNMHLSRAEKIERIKQYRPIDDVFFEVLARDIPFDQ